MNPPSIDKDSAHGDANGVKPPTPTNKNWFSELARLGFVGVRGIVELAKVARQGRATPGQIVFFSAGGFAIVATVLGIAISVAHPTHAIWVMVVLGVVILTLIVLMAGLMRTKPLPSGASKTELDDLRNRVASLTSELATCTRLAASHEEALTKAEATVHGLLAERDSATAAHSQARRTLLQIQHACQTMYHASTTTPIVPRFTEEDQHFFIEADGTLKARRTLSFVAVAHPQHMILERFFSSKPLDGFGALDLTLEDATSSIAMIPVRDEVCYKECLLFFLPQVTPGNVPTRYSLRYTWPKFWQPLIDAGVDQWEEEVLSTDAVPFTRFHLTSQIALSSVELVAYQPGMRGTVVANGRDLHGNQQFFCQIAEVPPGAKIVLTLRR